MGCGGIRLYHHDASLVKASPAAELPAFLTHSSVRNLFTSPIVFNQVQATEVGADSAVIDMDVQTASALKQGSVYFGTQDALTFAPRELHGTERNSDLSKAVAGQAWEQKVALTDVQVGLNRAVLKNLKPETTYYFRVLMSNEVSRVWTNETLSFTTPKSGTAPIKQAPLQAKVGSG